MKVGDGIPTPAAGCGSGDARLSSGSRASARDAGGVGRADDTHGGAGGVKVPESIGGATAGRGARSFQSSPLWAAGGSKAADALPSPADVITLLRRVQANAPVQLVLWYAGWMLVVGGVLQGVVQILLAYPFLLVIGAGVMCLAASAACHRDGLLAHMPACAQQFLLETTVFDLFHDNSFITNLARRWGRLSLLCYEPCEHQINQVVQGLDEEWLRSVFHKPLCGYLPDVVRRVLLPEEPQAALGAAAASPSPADAGAEAISSSAAKGMPAPAALMGGPLAALPLDPASGTTLAAQLPSSAEKAVGFTKVIKQKLREMDVARSKRINQPVLLPLVCRYVALQLLGDKWLKYAWRSVQAALAGAALSWGSYLVLLQSPAAQAKLGRWLKAACGKVGVRAAAAGEGALARRAAQYVAAAFSALGLGELAVIGLLYKLFGLRLPCASWAQKLRALTPPGDKARQMA